jgi:hypothetical protein
MIPAPAIGKAYFNVTESTQKQVKKAHFRIEESQNLTIGN